MGARARGAGRRADSDGRDVAVRAGRSQRNRRRSCNGRVGRRGFHGAGRFGRCPGRQGLGTCRRRTRAGHRDRREDDRLPGGPARSRPRPRGGPRRRHGEAGRGVRGGPRALQRRARSQPQAPRLPDAASRRRLGARARGTGRRADGDDCDRGDDSRNATVLPSRAGRGCRNGRACRRGQRNAARIASLADRCSRRRDGASHGDRREDDRLPGRSPRSRPRPRGGPRRRHGEAGRGIRRRANALRRRARSQLEAPRLPDASPRRGMGARTRGAGRRAVDDDGRDADVRAGRKYRSARVRSRGFRPAGRVACLFDRGCRRRRDGHGHRDRREDDRLPGRPPRSRPRPRGRPRRRHGEAGRGVRGGPRALQGRARSQSQAPRLPDVAPRRGMGARARGPRRARGRSGPAGAHVDLAARSPGGDAAIGRGADPRAGRTARDRRPAAPQG